MKNFTDKVVVITGAGSGIGRALAIEFKKLGAKLALNDFNQTTLLETVALLNGTENNIFHAAFDVSDRTAMFAFAENSIAHFKAVDVVINNAGLAHGGGKFAEVDLDKFERVMDVNFRGVVYGSRAFLHHLLQRPQAVLVNIASVYGLTGIADGESYVASKFAVNGLTQSLIQAYKKSNVSIHCVYPGGIQTNITKNSIDYEERDDLFDQVLVHTPKFAADTIINGIKKQKPRIIIGRDAYTIEILSRLAPVWGCGLINKHLEPMREEHQKLGASA
ncbi:MAG TPA: SDR family oxidoreductase [Anaerolineae bacterium]|nr:SDR family oxidoreductase [Anaerolineae bacterium]